MKCRDVSTQWSPKFIFQLTLLTVSALLLWNTPAAEAQTDSVITFISGNGSVGDRDASNQFTRDGGNTWHNAYIIEPHPAYDVIAATEYINWEPTYNSGPFNAAVRYRTTFVLPTDFSEPSLSLLIHADNVATIFLNGVEIGQQPFAEIFPNFQDPPDPFITEDSGLFQEGVNTVEFDIHNFGGPTAFDYKADVRFSSSSATVSIEPPRMASPAIGEEFTLNVNITDGVNVAGYIIGVTFDKTALSFVKIENADYFPPGAFVSGPEIEDGKVTLGAVAIGNSSNGDGTLAKVTFKVLAVKHSTIGLVDVLLADPSANSLSVTTRNGLITNPGDVNADGAISAFDAALILQFVVGAIPLTPDQRDAADVNGDNQVTALDAELILRFVVGIINEFPVQS